MYFDQVEFGKRLEYYCDVMDENENILAFMNQAFVPVET
ncbi:MAG: thioredoxin domain-containing protein [Lachnospiraceae bacterium]|nr:thioredoxin domain-containing protein [Lachnospiraceae bacterium]